MQIKPSITAVTYAAALSISVVSAYFSIVGLLAIFAASFWPIITMATTLEIGKLVSISWLQKYWSTSPKIIRNYLTGCVIILMVITSIGCFGLLSKAHLNQDVPAGDVAARVAFIEEKIKTEKDTVDSNKQAIKQLDAQVDQVLSRSTSEQGATRSASLRKSQQKERASLLEDIQSSQKRIASLNEEKAPIAVQLRKVEAEVGPIKYIAALIYGDNPDENTLEKAVRWVIIMIVTVFDPLAVMMLIAANWSLLNRKPNENYEQAPTTLHSPTPKGPVTEEKNVDEKGVPADEPVEEVQPQEVVIEVLPDDKPNEVETGTVPVEEHPVFKPEEEFWRSRPPSHLHR